MSPSVVFMFPSQLSQCYCHTFLANALNVRLLVHLLIFFPRTLQIVGVSAMPNNFAKVLDMFPCFSTSVKLFFSPRFQVFILVLLQSSCVKPRPNLRRMILISSHPCVVVFVWLESVSCSKKQSTDHNMSSLVK